MYVWDDRVRVVLLMDMYVVVVQYHMRADMNISWALW